MYEKFLKYDEIEITGWAREQLLVQARGLAGNLDKVWADVRDSSWIGGNRDGWERFPYFLDGFIPLAYLLKDEELIARADGYVRKMLACQREDGRIAPLSVTEDDLNADIWPIFLILKIFTEYAYFAGDKACEVAVYKGLKYLYGRLDKKTLFDWAAARWYECYIPLAYAYERTKEKWLLDLAVTLKVQGIDYHSCEPLWRDGVQRWNMEKHVVNAVMALKAEAMEKEVFKTPISGKAEREFRILDEVCGTPYGHFIGDEAIGTERTPSRGSELCGIVEAAFSYELLYAATGDGVWADRTETLAFNGLPAAISGDAWAHQYDQLTNQVACVKFEKPPFGDNGGESSLFGLEPNFGCCTANHGQGFPKFFRSAVMRAENGFTVVSPVPFKAKGKVGGKTVALECLSEYPFKNSFEFSCEGDFTLVLRVPKWAKLKTNAKYTTSGDEASFEVSGKTRVSAEFECEPIVEKREKGFVCVRYGALLFALPIKSEEEKLEYVRDGVERKYPYCDYVFRPAEKWNYALKSGCELKVVEGNTAAAFTKKEIPVFIKCKVVPIEWGYKAGYPMVADDLVCEKPLKILGKEEEKNLIPYGCTYLRIAELPEV